jgi:hypothetical protein
MRGEGEHAAFSWWALRAVSQGRAAASGVSHANAPLTRRDTMKRKRSDCHTARSCFCFSVSGRAVAHPARRSRADRAQRRLRSRRPGARDEPGEGSHASWAWPKRVSEAGARAEGGEDPRGSEGRRVSFRAVAMNHRHRAACGVERPEHPRRAGASDARDERSECHRRRPAVAGRVPIERLRRRAAQPRTLSASSA